MRSMVEGAAVTAAACIMSATRSTTSWPLAVGTLVLGDGEPKTGADGKPVLLLHPKDFSGALIEAEQA